MAFDFVADFGGDGVQLPVGVADIPARNGEGGNKLKKAHDEPDVDVSPDLDGHESGGIISQQGRSDDNEAVIRHRLGLYHEQTEAVVATYAERGILTRVDGIGIVDEVTERVIRQARVSFFLDWKTAMALDRAGSVPRLQQVHLGQRQKSPFATALSES